jgi:hypothetical protein
MSTSVVIWRMQYRTVQFEYMAALPGAIIMLLEMQSCEVVFKPAASRQPERYICPYVTKKLAITAALYAVNEKR